MGLKLAGGDAYPGLAQLLGEYLIEFLGHGGWRGVGERRPIALAAVGIQSKLRDRQDRAAAGRHRAIHFAQLIGKNA